MFRPLILTVVASISSAQLAVAQGSVTPAARQTPGLDVHLQADGALTVSASDAPLDEVIRSVALAAGMELTLVGAAPRDRVTVSFSDRSPARILRELMDPTGVSYLLTLGAAGQGSRLTVGLLSAGDASSVPVPASSIPSPMSAVSPPPSAPIAIGATADVSPRGGTRPQTSGPTEWPQDVQPVNLGGSVALPDTREALFQMVNGGAPVTLPGSVTPNADGAPRPDQIQSANPMSPNAPAPVQATALRPGVVPAQPPATATASGRIATPSVAEATPSGAVAPADPSMLHAPRTIAIPAPVVIEFPAPSASPTP